MQKICFYDKIITEFVYKGDIGVRYLLKNATVYFDRAFTKADLSVNDGTVAFVSPDITPLTEYDKVYDLKGCFIFPGFADVHVHFREPGFLYKETIKTGSMAAAHGGFTSVCTMPNLSPVPDCMENLNIQLEAIKSNASVRIYPYGAISVGEKGEYLSDMASMSEYVVAFSDDGRGVQLPSLMEEAMKTAKKYNKIIAAHCEDNSLIMGGYIHKGEYARLNGHKGISSESEYIPIKRDIELVKKTGCKYHVCHVSTKESVDLIRKAKADEVDITCETAPHYLVMNDMMLKDEGRFKMNPPIRSEEDRLALIEGIKDGTIDMIATDHAPHSFDEKNKGLKDSLMGIVGLETSFPILYTKLVKTNIITLEKLIDLMHYNPCKRFNIGDHSDITVFNLDEEYEIDPENFLSMGRSTPFKGEKVYGKCVMTIVNGKIVYEGDI